MQPRNPKNKAHRWEPTQHADLRDSVVTNAMVTQNARRISNQTNLLFLFFDDSNSKTSDKFKLQYPSP